MDVEHFSFYFIDGMKGIQCLHSVHHCCTRELSSFSCEAFLFQVNINNPSPKHTTSYFRIMYVRK